jgi:hypothetical protein
MISWLKKHFIPHKGNGHRPHILRGRNARNIVAIVIFLELFTFLIPLISHIGTTGQMAAVLPAVLADLTNQEREAQNLPALTVNPLLNEAAQMKANDMAANSYFAHTSPDGKTPWYWLQQAGYDYQYAGENLAINFSDSKDVTNAWMASPEHKANIVGGNYTEIGTAVASGMYQGYQTIFVVQDFANPLPVGQTQTQTEPVATKIEKVSTLASGTAKGPAILGAVAVPTPTVTVPVVQNTLIASVSNPTFWQKLLASPRNTTNIILYVVFGIIALALLLYILIKRKNHHTDLITNGLIILAIVGAIFVANYYLTHRDMIVAQSLDYSNQSK